MDYNQILLIKEIILIKQFYLKKRYNSRTCAFPIPLNLLNGNHTKKEKTFPKRA